MTTASYSARAARAVPGTPGSAARPGRPSGARRCSTSSESRDVADRVLQLDLGRAGRPSGPACAGPRAARRRGRGAGRSRPAASWRPRARASRRAPKATVVLPWLPSGLVTTIERMLSSVKSRFVRRSRSASATTRKRGFVARSSGECIFRIADSAGISAKTGAPLALARSSARLDLRGQVLAQQGGAESQAEAEQRGHEQRQPRAREDRCGRQSRRVQLEQLQRRDPDLVPADAVEQRSRRRRRRSAAPAAASCSGP